MGEVFGPVVLGLATYVAAQLTRAIRKRQIPQKPIDATHKDDVEITLILESARLRLNAQRVYLSQFHNGDHYLSDSDILRKSRTHERARPGCSYQAEAFRGVLISTLAEEMALVLAEGPSYTLVKDLPESKYRWLCEQGGAVAVARCAVRKGKKIVGFLGADFDTDVKPPDIESLCRDAYQIGNLLAGYK